ncbi:Bifunctional UDP-glucose 4-epimerase and UDP-xylose 4-epimerase 3 [Fusarium oxysporum f. sp. albedinis]|nr:Bifunctional UDP-glucose 4-epimerase and UDP-xylose 4-epimerase 3 [Fusarium oxysporum f. sp. albedinis]
MKTTLQLVSIRNDGSDMPKGGDPTKADRYTTLLYCWGGHQELQLNAKTKVTLMNSISISLLPRTLRDAILIYKNLFITISAARARHSNKGFLHDISSPPISKPAFKLPFAYPDGRLRSVILSRLYESNRACRYWINIVEEYTNQELMYALNKLLAISGVAKFNNTITTINPRVVIVSSITTLIYLGAQYGQVLLGLLVIYGYLQEAVLTKELLSTETSLSVQPENVTEDDALEERTRGYRVYYLQICLFEEYSRSSPSGLILIT